MTWSEQGVPDIYPKPPSAEPLKDNDYPDDFLTSADLAIYKVKDADGTSITVNGAGVLSVVSGDADSLAIKLAMGVL